jgi:hypothetical protein
MNGHPEIFFEGNSPSSPWIHMAQMVFEVRGGDRSSISISGPGYIGLSSPVIRYLIQRMDGAEKCVNYVMQRFDQPPERLNNLPRWESPEDARSSDLLPVPNIRYDEKGAPSFPIRLSSKMVVSDLGHIVTDRPGFHTDHYIYPAGFKSSRLYWSAIDPSLRVRYTSEIVDTGGQSPVFRVTMNDRPEVSFEGNSPTSPWNLIATRVMEIRGDKQGAHSLPGQKYFGLSSPVACYLIQRMDGADKCANYVMRPVASQATE